MARDVNCPFYGRMLHANLVWPPHFLLIDSDGNQCAIVADAHAPCMMEINRNPVEWSECPRVREMRMEPPD